MVGYGAIANDAQQERLCKWKQCSAANDGAAGLSAVTALGWLGAGVERATTDGAGQGQRRGQITAAKGSIFDTVCWR